MRARLLTVAGVGLLAGCVKETPVAGGSLFSFELWVGGGLMAAGLVGLLVGAVCLKRRAWFWGLLAVVLGLVGLLVAGPGMFADKVTVTDERFEMSVGFWFSPTLHSVKWDEVAGIEGKAEERSTRRGKRTDFSVVFRKKSGQTETVPVGDLMKRGPYNKLLEVADKKGIPITGVGPIMD